MPQIYPIDDYIEPQLIIQAKAREIESLTRNKDWETALVAITELQQQSQILLSFVRRKTNIPYDGIK